MSLAQETNTIVIGNGTNSSEVSENKVKVCKLYDSNSFNPSFSRLSKGDDSQYDTKLFYSNKCCMISHNHLIQLSSTFL